MNRAVGSLPLKVSSSLVGSTTGSSNILVNGLVKRFSSSSSTKKTDDTTTASTIKKEKTTSATATTTASGKPKLKYINKAGAAANGTNGSTPPPPPPPPSSSAAAAFPLLAEAGKRPPLFKPVANTGQSEMRFGRLHTAGEEGEEVKDDELLEEDDDDYVEIDEEDGEVVDPADGINEIYEINDQMREYFDLGSQPMTEADLDNALEVSDKKYGYNPATDAKPFVAPTAEQALNQVFDNFNEAVNQDILDAAQKARIANPLDDFEDVMHAKKTGADRRVKREGETLDDILAKTIYEQTESTFVDDEYEQERPQSFYDDFAAGRKPEQAETVAAELPYHRQSKEIESSLRMHLNKFLTKVHPDLFHNEPDKHNTNQKSLTTLNNLLRTRDQYIAIAQGNTDDTKVDRIPNTITLVFHHHHASGAQAIVEHEMLFEEASEQVATSKTALVEYVTELRFAVHRQLYDLFSKCDIPIPQLELDQLVRPSSKTGGAASSLVNDDPWDDYFGLNKPNGTFSLSNVLDDFLGANNVSERRKYSEITGEHETLLQQFNEDKVFFYYSESVKGDINVMRQLGYRDEAERQIIHLKKYLPALEFGTWSSLPIMITNPAHFDRLSNITQQRGFVVLLKDFVPEQTLPYIKKQVPKIRETFNQLYSVSKKNQDLLQKSTISLEKSLGASSVIIENLFSVNQRTMNQVRDKFNKAQTMVAKLNIPMTKMIDAAKASKWVTLPQTQLDGNVMDEWKVKHIEMDKQEQQKIVQKLNEAKLGIDVVASADERAILNENVERDMTRIAALTITSDRLTNPLTIVDTNKFNYVQSAPFVSDAMACIERLRSLVNNSVEVPMVLPEKMNDPDFLSKRDQFLAQDDQEAQEDESEMREYYQLLMGNSEMTVDKLSTRKSLAQIDSSLFTTSAAVVSSFNAPMFGEKTSADNQVDSSSSSAAVDQAVSDATAQGSELVSDQVKRFVNVLKNASGKDSVDSDATADKTKMIKPKQRLSDYGWANIHLVISDHYQFIVSKENDVAYVFVPMNFKESELFLFLNANYDKISLIQNIFYSPVLEKTQKMMQVQSIQTVISNIRSRVPFASLKIDNIAVSSPESQYAAVQLLKNTIYLSSDIKAFEKIAPYVDVIIGAESRVVYKNDEKNHAIIVVSHLQRSSMNLSKIIRQLCEQSPFFKSLLPNFTYQPFDPSSSSKQPTTSN
ncbi:hypothetical protein DFA_00512 [Cavenderia fasciculata]|uniref:DUF4460 domain-containing protein n=1 Tax=Cavenderia fasciculata TaxID=261658 RepID=F4PSA5_CACFS|nr:uncharacterized protein DFA_00512 [Cavenderia fasciculata]EGG20651.1 hypothetical protein DFA_00512 [Cavenderia fasciculata]|eukprot:XP_004358501.1 hypothetical protein DFA_00512 [Cavenderia fasciculata]